MIHCDKTKLSVVMYMVFFASVVDPYHFDMDPTLNLRKLLFFFKQNYDYFLLINSLLFIYINQKSDLCLKIIWYSYIFVRFFFTRIRSGYFFPFHDTDPDPAKWYRSDRIRIHNTVFCSMNNCTRPFHKRSLYFDLIKTITYLILFPTQVSAFVRPFDRICWFVIVWLKLLNI